MEKLVKKRMKKKRKKFWKRNLNEQMQSLVLSLIIMMTCIVLAVSTFSTVTSSYQKAEDDNVSQLNFMSYTYEKWLNTVKDLALTLQLDHTVQEYCSYLNPDNMDYLETRINTKSILNSQLNLNSELNFIAIYNKQMDNYVYAGNMSLIFSRFDKEYKSDYRNSMKGKERGSFYINYSNNFYDGTLNTVSFYQPLYSNSILDKEIGIVCINIEDNMLESMQSSVEQSSRILCMTDAEGTIISTTDSNIYQKQTILADFGKNTQGSFQKDGKCYFYQKIADWNIYLVSIVPMQSLYSSSIRTAFIIAMVGVALMLVAFAIMKAIIQRSYIQIQTVVDAMDAVADHQLNFRINTENMGEDFERLGEGFNSMVQEINLLLDKVRAEQHQMDQIRLNALQSQIQPHFLYNTLDCIHWQARADGNKEISDLVMALANYYRICLSKGKELIPFQQELEHVRNYLLIQNKRYGDIIRYEIQMDEEVKNVCVPKLMLQPLVENSIYHGIRIKEGFSGKVLISTVIQEKTFWIEVSDTGNGMKQSQIDEMNEAISKGDEGFGYGVRNVNRRIQLIYGMEYGLHYKINANGGVTVLIRLPCEFNEEQVSIFGGENNV